MISEIETTNWFWNTLILKLLLSHLVLNYSILLKNSITRNYQDVSIHWMKAHFLYVNLIEILRAQKFAWLYSSTWIHRPFKNHDFGTRRIKCYYQVFSIIWKINRVYLSLISRKVDLPFKKVDRHLKLGTSSIILNSMNGNISFLIVLLDIPNCHVFLRVEPERCNFHELIEIILEKLHLICFEVS